MDAVKLQLVEAMANVTRLIRGLAYCQESEAELEYQLGLVQPQPEVHQESNLVALVVSWCLAGSLLACSMARMAYLWVKGEEAQFPLDR